MGVAEPSSSPAKIDFVVCLSLQGPIIPGNYKVKYATINVSYPNQVGTGLPSPIKLPKGVSTLFIVSWLDAKGRTRKALKSKSFDRHLPIYVALNLISRLLMAFKLVRIGHADGMRIRTVGISDTLFYWSLIDGVPTGDLNLGMRLDQREYPWTAGGERSFGQKADAPSPGAHGSA